MVARRDRGGLTSFRSFHPLGVGLADDIGGINGGGFVRFLDEEGADGEGIESGGPEGAEGIARGANDGFAFDIEGGIEEDGYACFFFKAREEAVVGGVLLGVDGLDAHGVVDVNDGGGIFGGGLGGIEGHDHKGGGIAFLEVVVDAFFFHGGAEGTPVFAEFDGLVDAISGFDVAGIGEDGACAEGAGAAFHATLEPTDDFSLCEQGSGCIGDIIVSGVGHAAALKLKLDLIIGITGAKIDVGKRFDAFSRLFAIKRSGSADACP